jgi:hypothetical protein
LIRRGIRIFFIIFLVDRGVAFGVLAAEVEAVRGFAFDPEFIFGVDDGPREVCDEVFVVGHQTFGHVKGFQFEIFSGGPIGFVSLKEKKITC